MEKGGLVYLFSILTLGGAEMTVGVPLICEIPNLRGYSVTNRVLFCVIFQVPLQFVKGKYLESDAGIWLKLEKRNQK